MVFFRLFTGEGLPRSIGLVADVLVIAVMGNARERAGHYIVVISFNGGLLALKVAVYQVSRQAILTFSASLIAAHMVLMGMFLKSLFNMCTMTLMLNTPCVYRYM